MSIGKMVTVTDYDDIRSEVHDFGSDEVAAAEYAAGRRVRTITVIHWEDGTVWRGINDPVAGTVTWIVPEEDLAAVPPEYRAIANESL